jgi:hypothetical protein
MLTGDTPIRDDGYEGGSVEVECEEIISRAELLARRLLAMSDPEEDLGRLIGDNY